jgi:hypothetical protein
VWRSVEAERCGRRESVGEGGGLPGRLPCSLTKNNTEDTDMHARSMLTLCTTRKSRCLLIGELLLLGETGEPA